MRNVRMLVRTGEMLEQLLERLIADEGGQDLIEYALLTSAIGFCGVAGFNLLGVAINVVYTSWTDGPAGVNSLWQVPNPQP
jgi:Flp pilus assembly pilin Flp